MLEDLKLIEAVRTGCVSDFNEAVRAGASASAKSPDGHHALVVAYKAGQSDLARRLLALGASADEIVDGRGDHLIHRAARTGDYGFLSALLEAGVDPNLRGAKQRTALHHSARLGHEYSVRLLISNGADIKAEDANGDTPFRLASHQKILINDQIHTLLAVASTFTPK